MPPLSHLVRQTLTGLRAMLVLTLLLGVLYPAAVWGAGQLVARDQATGSLVTQGGAVVGSSLLGQQWSGPGWFHSRPSVSDNAGDTSGGSNLGPGPALDAEVAKRAAAEGLDPATAPPDAVTTSASGLDPHISPAYAAAQVARVAAARGVAQASLLELVGRHTEGRAAGFLGQPRVDVLALNLDLQRLAGAAGR